VWFGIRHHEMANADAWWRRLPRSLFQPWRDLKSILFWYSPMAFGSAEPSAWDQHIAESLAKRYWDLLDLDQKLQRVLDEFVAAADGVIRWEGAPPYLRYHSCAHAYALTRLAVCIKGVLRRLPDGDEQLEQDKDAGVTEQRIRENFAVVVKALRQPDIPWFSQEEDYLVRCQLEREVCKAADRRLVTKRSFPGDEVPITLTEEDIKVLFESATRFGPAYERNRLWRKWRHEEKLTPAKIRDRWNSMTDLERREVCPTACNRIGQGKAGREVVKKALTAAKQNIERIS